jgi:hypothetical protein
MAKGKQEPKREDHDITGTAFAVVQLPDDEQGRAVWAPLRLTLDGGIVVAAELAAMDATSYQTQAYRYLASAVITHGGKVCAEYVRPRQCDHGAVKPWADAPAKARLTGICEACGARQFGGAGPWFEALTKQVAHV